MVTSRIESRVVALGQMGAKSKMGFKARMEERPAHKDLAWTSHSEHQNVRLNKLGGMIERLKSTKSGPRNQNPTTTNEQNESEGDF